MTPAERISIYMRLDHDRALAEKHLSCSLYTACAGVRNPTRKLCAGCPLKVADV